MAQQNEQFGISEHMAQQTAVDWLIEQLAKTDPRNLGEILTIHQQAKEMFQEQIEKAHGEDRSYLQDDGSWKTINGEQYYNETYGK